MIYKPEFPKSMGTSRARKWLDANNPYPFGTVAYREFERDFWSDQSLKAGRRAITASIVSVAFLMVALVCSVIALVVN